MAVFWLSVLPTFAIHCILVFFLIPHSFKTLACPISRLQCRKAAKWPDNHHESTFGGGSGGFGLW